MTTYLYVGSFTTADRNGHGEGIYVYRMDGDAGALTHVQTVEGVDNPSFLALHPSGNYVYCNNAVLEHDGRPGGAVSAFAVDRGTGRLTFLNRQPSGGVSPAHVVVDPSGRYVLAANYGSGSLAVLPVERDGRVSPPSDVVQHGGPPGPNRDRQAGPHAHQVMFDPSGRHVLANDLGLDSTFVYKLDPQAGKLVPNDPAFVQARPGSGPRHLAFHPSERYVYVINEISSTIGVFGYDPATGTLSPVQEIPTLPEGFGGTSTTAQVLVHPSGRFVYGSNRGHDSIAIFAVDEASGELTLVAHEPTQNNPRNFNFDPSARLLLAANQDGDSIVAFRVDTATGRLSQTGQVTRVGSPVCLVFHTI